MVSEEEKEAQSRCCACFTNTVINLNFARSTELLVRVLDVLEWETIGLE